MVVDLAMALLAELVAPTRCVACDARVRMRSLFCASCAVSVELGQRKGDELAVFSYGGAVATAIVSLKYRSRSDLATRFGPVLRETLAPALTLGLDLVVPVPLHHARLAERGYNQAALLARAAAGGTRLVHDPRALERVRPTPKQANLDRAARIANVASAFRCPKPAKVRGRSIVLVDDVRTTGATLAACNATLLASGAKKVVTLVLASRDETPIQVPRDA